MITFMPARLFWRDVLGVKLRKEVRDRSEISTTDYLDGFIYLNEKLDFFPHSEGYVKVIPVGNYYSFQYVFQYKDHLGNIRLSYSDIDGDGTINAATEIVQENNYYPFGLEHKGYNTDVSPSGNSVARKFKFNGIEHEEALGLNLYEMDFRQYDPAIARFTSIDPVTHHDFSTYTAFDNNPVFFADPSGADSESPIDLINDAWNQTPENGSATFDNQGNCQCGCPVKPPCAKKKAVREMNAGEFYAMAYNGPSKTAYLNGNDPYNPTDEDIAQNEREKAEAAGQVVLFVVGEWAVAKVLQGGIYVYKLVKFKSVFSSAMSASVKDKLARYLLNFDHTTGSSKAEFFKDALGFTINNADDLAKQIVFNNKKAIATEVTKYGTKYSQNIAIKGANGRVVDVTFGWIKNKDGLVKLVTGYPAK
ncbi:RHS repeat domain-containing protein [Aequorivita ciconiae]|uniref:RHS repeat domain-containing protein n=1 Tax=Aequorivita ciconiae TaxID=2494375 RepID=UPI0013E28A0C|nr:RHS repeat-associated core domain-containing protein [Aequorivita sp. H23M31]